MKHVIFAFAILAAAVPCSCDLTRAYSYYLLGKYDSALVYYRAVKQESPAVMDAYYGIMNCFIAQKQYDSALVTAESALKQTNDKIIYDKCAYVYGLRNDIHNASQMYEAALSAINTEKTDSSTRKRNYIDLIEAVGYGFYGAKKYRQALHWFQLGDSAYPGEGLFAVPRSQVQASLRSRWIGQSSLFGGGISYSNSAMFSNGDYEGLSGAVLFDKRLHLKMEYAHTRISLKTQYYGITYDTLISSRGEHPDVSRGQIFDMVDYINLDGNPDTAYYTRSYTRVNSANATEFDSISVVHVSDYRQDDIYLALTDYYSLFDKTKILAGCRFSGSNIPYSEYANTVFVGHFSKINVYSLGAEYYLTILPDFYIYQISPAIEADFGKIGATVRANLIKAETKDAVSEGIPTFLQVAPDINVRFGGSVFKLTLTATLGKRAFCNEDQGEFLHNISAPYRGGFKGLAEWTPFKFPMTFYYVFKYAAYNEYSYKNVAYDGYSMMVNMGGMFIQW